LNNPIKRLAGQTVIYGLSSIIGRFLNYLLTPLYTFLLVETSDYGVITEMYAYAGFFTVLFTYGMETAFFRFNESSAEKQKVFSTAQISVLISSFLLFIFMILFSGNVAGLLSSNSDTTQTSLSASSYQSYIIWFALIFALDAITAIPFAKLRAENRPVRFAWIKLVNIGLNIGLNLYFLLAAPYLAKKMGLENGNFLIPASPQVAYIFISNLIASAVTFLLLLPEMLRSEWKFDFSLWRKMIVYALPLLIVGFAGVINEMLDRVILKFLLPGTMKENMAELGIYGACYKLSILMTLFIQAYRYAAEPFFFSQSTKQNAKAVYASSMKYFVIVSCIIFLGVMLYLDIVKYFIPNEKYWEGLKVVPILLLANLFLGIYFNLSIWYKLTDKTKWGAWISIGGALITVFLNWLWIPWIGYLGSAWATLICYANMAVASYFLSMKFYPVKYNLRKIFLYISLAVLIYIANDQFLKMTGIENPLVKYSMQTVFLFAYLGFVYLFERMTKSPKPITADVIENATSSNDN